MGEELRHALAEILTRGEAHDPDLRDAAITVTEVRVSPDLRNATAFVTPLGGDKMDRTIAALKRARGFFRAQIAKTVEARFVPELRFEPDTSFEEAERVEELIRDARERDRLSAAAAEEAADEAAGRASDDEAGGRDGSA